LKVSQANGNSLFYLPENFLEYICSLGQKSYKGIGLSTLFYVKKISYTTNVFKIKDNLPNGEDV